MDKGEDAPLAEELLGVDPCFRIESVVFSIVIHDRLAGHPPVNGPTLMHMWAALTGFGGLFLKREEEEGGATRRGRKKRKEGWEGNEGKKGLRIRGDK